MRATACLIALAAIIGGVASAAADETGMASIHSWRQVGGRTCLVEHFHDGNGSGATQKAAMSEAIKSWEGFTSLEYGSDWGRYANSISKSATCDRGSSGFTCQVSSVACKGGAVARQRRRVSMHAE